MPNKYKLSPSASERFLVCSASLPYNVDFIENEATLKGNLQHEAAFLRLDQLFNNADHTKRIELLTDYKHEFLGKNPNLMVKWDLDCEKTVNNYITYIKKIVYEYAPKKILFEHRMKIAFYDNRMNGIIDCAMVLPNDDLFIVDLKTGRVKVDTTDNNQMLLYASGLIQQMYDKEKSLSKNVIISICQSLVNNTKAVKYSLDQVVKWYRSHAEKMEEINSGKLRFNPTTKACKYCQHRAECDERIRKGVI